MVNCDILTEEPITYQLQDGTLKEGASRKEEYFSIKTKALEKSEKYDKCIECCKVALESISKFHYDNDIWFEVRKNYCTCMLLNGDTFIGAINELISLSNNKKHWSIYNKIFSCYCKIGDYKNAIIFGAKALISKEPMEMKVTLLCDFAYALEVENYKTEAGNHFALVFQIRKKSGWNISPEIIAKLAEYNISDDVIINVIYLRSFWIELLRAAEETYAGKILSMMPHGKSGFICGDDNLNYFFKKSSVISGYNKLQIGKKVLFRIIDSIDKKKQVVSKEAVDITIA